MNVKLLKRGACAVLLLCGVSAALADDEKSAEKRTDENAATAGERCIPIRSIRQTKVLDDQNVLFYTTGNRNYKNHLPHTCGGLAIADSFMYRTSQSQLCSVDLITVLNRMGSNFTPGPSCGLGTFEPLTPQQLEELTKKPKD